MAGFTPIFSPDGIHWTIGPNGVISQAYDATASTGTRSKQVDRLMQDLLQHKANSRLFRKSRLRSLERYVSDACRRRQGRPCLPAFQGQTGMSAPP